MQHSHFEEKLHVPRVPSTSAAEDSCLHVSSIHPLPPSERKREQPIHPRNAPLKNVPGDGTCATSDQNELRDSATLWHQRQFPHDTMTSRSNSYLKVHARETWSIHVSQLSIPPSHLEDKANELKLVLCLCCLCGSSQHFFHCRSTKSSFWPWFAGPKNSPQRLPLAFCSLGHWESWKGSHQQKAWSCGFEVRLQSSGKGKGGNCQPLNVWNEPAILAEVAKTTHRDPNGTSSPPTLLHQPFGLHGRYWAAVDTFDHLWKERTLAMFSMTSNPSEALEYSRQRTQTLWNRSIELWQWLLHHKWDRQNRGRDVQIQWFETTPAIGEIGPPHLVELTPSQSADLNEEVPTSQFRAKCMMENLHPSCRQTSLNLRTKRIVIISMIKYVWFSNDACIDSWWFLYEPASCMMTLHKSCKSLWFKLLFGSWFILVQTCPIETTG